MNIFFKLSSIGQELVIPFITSFLDWFNKPVEYVFKFNTSDTSIFGKLLNLLFNGILQLFKLFGLDTSIPLWQFIFINLGVLIALVIVINLVFKFI